MPLFDNLDDAKKHIQKLNKEIKDLGSVGFRDVDKAIKNMGEGLEGANEVIATLNARIETQKNDWKSVNSIVANIQEELGKSNQILNKSRGAFKSIQSLSQDLLSDEEGIVKLSEKDLTKKIAKAEQAKLIVKEQARLIRLQGKTKKQLTEEEKEILGQVDAMENKKSVMDDAIKAMKKRLDQEKNINKSLGVGGNLLKASGELLDKMGLGALKSVVNFDKINDELRTMTEEATKNGDEILGWGGKLKIAAKGAKMMGGDLLKAFTDPSVMIGKIIEGMFAVNKAQTEFGKETGRNINTWDTLNFRMGVDSVDYIKAATELTKELGVAADAVFEPEDIAEAAEFTNHIGLASKETANLAKFSKLNSQSLEQTGDNVVNMTNEYIKGNKAAINQKKVLSDVGNVSDSLAASLGASPEKIAEAAIAAQALGLSLQEVDGIASSLLNIESSIEKEMEAEVLLGKELNLEKARTAALNNDHATLSEEIKNQVGGLHEFSQMNRLEQEAMAEAMGMNRDQLAKTIMQQEISAGMSEEQAAKLAGVNLEDFKRQETQEKIAKALDKIAQAFAPIIQLAGWLLSKTWVIYTTLILIAGVKLWQNAERLGAAWKSISKGVLGAGKGISSFFTSAEGGFKKITGAAKSFSDRFKKGMIGGGKGGNVAKKVLTKDSSKALGETAKNTKGMSAKKGAGIGGFLKGLGEGLSSVGRKFVDVIKGGLALGIVGVLLGGSFALSMMMLKDVDPVQMIAFAGSLAILGITMALLGNFGGNIIMGAIAMGILALALIPAAYAFSLLSEVDPGQMFSFAIALPLLALAAAGLGFLFPFIAAGAAALAILGMGLMAFAVGAAIAMSLTPNLETFVSQLQLFADASLIASLYAIGPALLVAGAGILAFQTLLAVGSVAGAVGGFFSSLFGGESDPLAPIKTLAALAPALQIAGDAISSISSNIVGLSSAIETLDLEKLSELKNLAFWAAIGGPMMMMGALMAAPLLTLGEQMSLGSSEGDGTAKKLDKITEVLEEILNKEGVVMLDSDKVGIAMTKGEYKLQ